jgi:mRNA interferase RelE/StbE
MIYEVELSDRLKKNLKKLDKPIAKTIVKWIERNLEGCSNPRIKGKQMSANHSDKWRYRIGDYRLIVKIEDGKLLILAITVGHRREIYNEDV